MLIRGSRGFPLGVDHARAIEVKVERRRRSPEASTNRIVGMTNSDYVSLCMPRHVIIDYYNTYRRLVYERCHDRSAGRPVFHLGVQLLSAEVSLFYYNNVVKDNNIVA